MPPRYWPGVPPYWPDWRFPPPPLQAWLGGPSPTVTGLTGGTTQPPTPGKDLGLGTREGGIPLPPCGQTDTCENIINSTTFSTSLVVLVVLHMRAVTKGLRIVPWKKRPKMLCETQMVVTRKKQTFASHGSLALLLYHSEQRNSNETGTHLYSIFRASFLEVIIFHDLSHNETLLEIRVDLTGRLWCLCSQLRKRKLLLYNNNRKNDRNSYAVILLRSQFLAQLCPNTRKRLEGDFLRLGRVQHMFLNDKV